MNRIFLTASPTLNGYSVEAGKADNKKHFDHHGQFSDYPCPANNERIPVITGEEIEITHIDADTFLGLCRMCGKELPDLDYNLLEQIDLNGSSVCPDLYNTTLLYMLGIGTLSRNLRFPRVTDEHVDVTEIIEKIMSYTSEEIIDFGRQTQNASEQAYRDCFCEKKDNVILFYATADDALDPSRAYRGDRSDIVVVYREHFKSISIYCNPKCEYQFGGKVVAGIQFAGHPQACGSPRGQEMTFEQAQEVFEKIVEQVGFYNVISPQEGDIIDYITGGWASWVEDIFRHIVKKDYVVCQWIAEDEIGDKEIMEEKNISRKEFTNKIFRCIERTQEECVVAPEFDWFRIEKNESIVFTFDRFKGLQLLQK